MGRSKRRTRDTQGVGGAVQALPALSSLSDLPTFLELRPSEAQLAAFARRDTEAADRLQLGCVVRLDRGFPAVMCEDGLVRAEFSAQLTKGSFSRVAVGDWVCARMPTGHDMALIEEILPRESDVARWRGSTRGERQTLAANVDVVIVVVALSAAGISAARVARSVVVARDSGADAAIVLTKADRAGVAGLGCAMREIREVLGDGVRMVVTCAAAEGSTRPCEIDELRCAAETSGASWGLAGVRELVGPGRVAIVLGESGAGKSTLLNALLGRDVLRTGAVREADDAGRHTTVARRMVSIPGAGVVVDEPGLRSLPLVGHERGLALVFPQIAAAARTCRFRDCTHRHEPGCAVREALAKGSFGVRSLEVYLSLATEMRTSAGSLDPDVVL